MPTSAETRPWGEIRPVSSTYLLQIFEFRLGKQHGAQAAQYWGDKQEQTGNWLYAILGALASLWTPCSSNKTALALGSASALGTKGASLSNFSWDSRNFSTISRGYWGAEGANGMSLDHWL